MPRTVRRPVSRGVTVRRNSRYDSDGTVVGVGSALIEGPSVLLVILQSSPNDRGMRSLSHLKHS